MISYGFTSTSMYGMGWRVLRRARYGWDSASNEQIKFCCSLQPRDSIYSLTCRLRLYPFVTLGHGLRDLGSILAVACKPVKLDTARGVVDIARTYVHWQAHIGPVGKSKTEHVMSQQRTNKRPWVPGVCRGILAGRYRALARWGNMVRGVDCIGGVIRFDIRVWRESRTESAGVGWLGVRGGGQNMLPCMGWPVCHVTFVLRESSERIDGHEEQHVVGLAGCNFQIMSAGLRNPGDIYSFFFQVVIFFFGRVQVAE